MKHNKTRTFIDYKRETEQIVHRGLSCKRSNHGHNNEKIVYGCSYLLRDDREGRVEPQQERLTSNACFRSECSSVNASFYGSSKIDRL